MIKKCFSWRPFPHHHGNASGSTEKYHGHKHMARVDSDTTSYRYKRPVWPYLLRVLLAATSTKQLLNDEFSQSPGVRGPRGASHTFAQSICDADRRTAICVPIPGKDFSIFVGCAKNPSLPNTSGHDNDFFLRKEGKTANPYSSSQNIGDSS